MAIFIKDEDYKELSKVFLKDIKDYTKICKMYICTGPNQYELLFDSCPDIFCDGTEDGECSDCRVRWLSIYDDLLIGTDGPTIEGLSKIVCPEETCNLGVGLTTICLDDEICCDCPILGPIPDLPGEDPPTSIERCEPIIDPNCECLELDNTHCGNLPSYLNNTCAAYAWTALGGNLLEDNLCNSCAIPERTEIGKCCIYGRKYSYIKKVIWNQDPTLESNCGIKKNCPINLFDEYLFKELNDNTNNEGGIANENKGPISCNKFTGCNECEPTCCASNSDCGPCSQIEFCQRACSPAFNDRCREYFFRNRYTDICSYCAQVATEENDPCDCIPEPPCEPGEPDCDACDVCVLEPCSPFCEINCKDIVDPCDKICGPPIDWWCAISIAGTENSAHIDLVRRCGCLPDLDTCEDICYS